MRATLDLKHVGLIVSAGAAVALRCFSDFGFATIQQNATEAGLDLSHFSFGSFVALFLNAVVAALQRDWFNLSPQAPLQIMAILVGLVAIYGALRRSLAAEVATTVVLLMTLVLPLVATAGACAWVLLRAARAA